MMTSDNAMEGLMKILEFLNKEDVEAVARRIDPGNLYSNRKPREKLIDEIISNATNPLQVLRIRRVRTYAIGSYLRQVGLNVSHNERKMECINRCLDLWNKKKDVKLVVLRSEKCLIEEIQRAEQFRDQQIKLKEEEYNLEIEQLNSLLESDKEKIINECKAKVDRCMKDLENLKRKKGKHFSSPSLSHAAHSLPSTSASSSRTSGTSV